MVACDPHLVYFLVYSPFVFRTQKKNHILFILNWTICFCMFWLSAARKISSRSFCICLILVTGAKMRMREILSRTRTICRQGKYFFPILSSSFLVWILFIFWYLSADLFEFFPSKRNLSIILDKIFIQYNIKMTRLIIAFFEQKSRAFLKKIEGEIEAEWIQKEQKKQPEFGLFFLLM